MKIRSYLKAHLRWVILGGTLFFLFKALKDHWQEVTAIRLSQAGWVNLACALGVTLIAHIYAGWVWSWILKALNQPVNGFWGIQVYLKTNIAKYLPGNVWHYYGRVQCATGIGVSLGTATLSVLLEALLMAAAALLIGLIGSQQRSWGWQLLSLGAVAIAVHPRVLNFGIKLLNRLKANTKRVEIAAGTLQIERYPLLPLLGELGFVAMRGAGFLLTLLALSPVSLSQIPLLMGTFSLAWLLGLVVPGVPGGVGVFEATVLALLDQRFSAALMLSTVALYRPISILAEVAGAGLAVLYEHHRLRA